MKNCYYVCLFLLGVALTAFAVPADPLELNFLNPPAAARPGVYWYFMDGNLNGKEMTADLESMKQAGLGNLVLGKQTSQNHQFD